MLGCSLLKCVHVLVVYLYSVKIISGNVICQFLSTFNWIISKSHRIFNVSKNTKNNFYSLCLIFSLQLSPNLLIWASQKITPKNSKRLSKNTRNSANTWKTRPCLEGKIIVSRVRVSRHTNCFSDIWLRPPTCYFADLPEANWLGTQIRQQ